MITTLLIVCPLCLIAGFVDAIAGGGGLISLPAFLFAGLPVHLALGTNKLQASCGTLIAAIRYAMNGYMVKAFVILGVACGLLGSFAGSNLALAISERPLKLFMLFALPVAAFYILRKKDLNDHEGDELPRKKALLITAAIALLIGAYDGFIGTGAGTFMMILLTGLAHSPLNQAAGTTKAINLTTQVTALVVFFVHGQVLVPLGIAAALFNVAGNYLGTRAFQSKGSAIVRPVILLVIILFAIKLVGDLFF